MDKKKRKKKWDFFTLNFYRNFINSYTPATLEVINYSVLLSFYPMHAHFFLNSMAIAWNTRTWFFKTREILFYCCMHSYGLHMLLQYSFYPFSISLTLGRLLGELVKKEILDFLKKSQKKKRNKKKKKKMFISAWTHKEIEFFCLKIKKNR